MDAREDKRTYTGHMTGREKKGRETSALYLLNSKYARRVTSALVSQKICCLQRDGAPFPPPLGSSPPSARTYASRTNASRMHGGKSAWWRWRRRWGSIPCPTASTCASSSLAAVERGERAIGAPLRYRCRALIVPFPSSPWPDAATHLPLWPLSKAASCDTPRVPYEFSNAFDGDET